MTKLDMEERCRWCGRRFEVNGGRGRPRRFCRPGCRQQAHIARKVAAAHGLDDSAVIVDRSALEEMQGALYCLQAAIEDVDRDLAHDDSAVAAQEALQWLLDNARPLAAMWVEPRTTAFP